MKSFNEPPQPDMSNPSLEEATDGKPKMSVRKKLGIAALTVASILPAKEGAEFMADQIDQDMRIENPVTDDNLPPRKGGEEAPDKVPLPPIYGGEDQVEAPIPGDSTPTTSTTLYPKEPQPPIKGGGDQVEAPEPGSPYPTTSIADVAPNVPGVQMHPSDADIDPTKPGVQAEAQN